MCKKMICLMSFVLLLGVGIPAFAQATYPGRMGINFGFTDVFVDVVKQGYRWSKPDGSGGWTDLTSSDVDADGWPKTDVRWVQDWRPVAEWSGSIDDPDVYRVDRSGVYKCSFTGQATLTHIDGPFTIENQAYDSGSNTTTFDINISAPGTNHGLIVMSFTDTKRTPSDPVGSGLTNYKVIRPGYPADTTQIFNQPFLDAMNYASFAYIRVMDFANTNGNTEWDAEGPILQHWANRKKTTDATQNTMSTLNKKDGAAWEYHAQLCNTLNKDLWLNIPVAVDDDYILQLATLIHNNLNSNLNIYLEYSNEVWNYGFNQYSWNKAMAEDEVNAGGSDLDYDGSTDHEVWARRRYARRTKEIVDIFASVFGTGEINNRLRGVMCWWTGAGTGNYINMLNYLNDNHGAPSGYLYAIGITTYFAGNAATGGSGTENYTVDQILDDMHNDILSGAANRQDLINLAATWNLVGGCCAYEGGPGGGGGSTTNIANRITAHRVQRMATEYKFNAADNFFDLGGNLMTQFSLYSSYNRYGMWGLTDDITNPDRNYKFGAVRDLLGDSATEPPLAPTNLAATAGDSQVFLTWDPSSGAQSYNVKRSTTSGGPYTEIATGITDTQYTDTDLANGTTYYYVVSATNQIGESGNSNEASATPAPDTTPPAAPTGLTADPGNTKAYLDWNDNAESDLSYYNVYRDTTSGGPYTQVATDVTSSDYTDTGLTNGTTYYYVVTAVDTSSNESQYSGEASVTPQAGGTATLNPTADASTQSSDCNTAYVRFSQWNQIMMKFELSSIVIPVNSATLRLYYEGTEARQIIIMDATSDVWDECGTLPSKGSTQMAYVDATGAGWYEFDVTSYVGTEAEGDNVITFCITSDAGNWQKITSREGANPPELVVVYGSGGSPPAAPANLSATPLDSQVDLTWDASAGADTYTVYRGTGGNYNPVASGLSDTSYSDSAVTNGTTYYYYVTAVNTNGESEASNQVSATPQPAPGQASNPSPADAATDVSTTATLSWTAGTGADSHNVYFGTASPGTFQGNQTAATFDPGTLANSTTYYWRIDEVNAYGTTTGVVWSFTTIAAPPGQASNPSPADAATGVDINADLSWTAGAGADSHDVYFGTVTSPPFVQNQTATTYDPGTLAEVTTYYWRIDEVGAGGTTTGIVWSFTTAAGCVSSTTHVESIVCDTLKGDKGARYGQVTVTIYDNCGNAVSGADVTGTFTGDFNEQLTGTTDGTGAAVITTTTQVKRPSYTFCVDNVIHATLTYNSADNAETCDSY